MQRLYLFATRMFAWIVPRIRREAWRRDWIEQIGHDENLLRGWGFDAAEIRMHLLRRCGAAFANAVATAYEAAQSTVAPRVTRASSCLAVLGLVSILIAIASRGFVITRSMIWPTLPEEERLVLIAEFGIMFGQQVPVSKELLSYWQSRNMTLSGIAAYGWDSDGTGFASSNLFEVLGVRPRRFLLRQITDWKPLEGADFQRFGVVGRLKPGVVTTEAELELRNLAAELRRYRAAYPYQEADVQSLLTRTRQPVFAHGIPAGIALIVLLLTAVLGIAGDLRRAGRIYTTYWLFLCAKSIGILAILLAITWEFTGATSIPLNAGTSLMAGPFSIWLIIVLSCGAAWWSLADQQARCRSCLRLLLFPVRIGSIGAILFDHAGTELSCGDGHGGLYLPEPSSHYVQGRGWSGL